MWPFAKIQELQAIIKRQGIEIEIERTRNRSWTIDNGTLRKRILVLKATSADLRITNKKLADQLNGES